MERQILATLLVLIGGVLVCLGICWILMSKKKIQETAPIQEEEIKEEEIVEEE